MKFMISYRIWDNLILFYNQLHFGFHSILVQKKQRKANNFNVWQSNCFQIEYVFLPLGKIWAKTHSFFGREEEINWKWKPNYIPTEIVFLFECVISYNFPLC